MDLKKGIIYFYYKTKNKVSLHRINDDYDNSGSSAIQGKDNNQKSQTELGIIYKCIKCTPVKACHKKCTATPRFIKFCYKCSVWMFPFTMKLIADSILIEI
jgi:hypothetical protein